MIAHAGDSNDLEYLREIADTGAALGFDRFNIPFFNPDADRIETLAALVAEGYSDRVHLGHDAACFYDFMVGDPNFADEKPDYLHIWRTVLPALLEAGVTQAQIDEMTTAERAAVLRAASPLTSRQGPGLDRPRGAMGALRCASGRLCRRRRRSVRRREAAAARPNARSRLV